MKNKLAKLLALFVITALVVSMLPITAFAAKYQLSNLRLNGETLSPSFKTGTYSYTATVPYSRSKIRVVPTVTNTNASKVTIAVDGTTTLSNQGVDIDLAEGATTTISVTVTDSNSSDVNTYTIEVERLEKGQTPLKITTSSMADGVVGRRYDQRIQVSGSGRKYFTVDNLPDGLELDEETGRISGTPRDYSDARYTVTVEVTTDSNSTTASRNFSFRIYERGTRLQDDENDEASSAPASTPKPPAANTKPSTATPSQQNIINQVQNRINSAAAGATVSPRFRNLGVVELKTLQTIAKAAGSRALRLSSERQYGDGLTESRVTIDPKASTKTVSLLSSTTISSENCKNVTALMNRFYSNQVSVIRLDQKGAYGQTATVYAKLDNARLNTASLKFYSYDSAANTLNAINTGYRVSETGYVTFNTTVGNYVIVTDSAIKRK